MVTFVNAEYSIENTNNDCGCIVLCLNVFPPVMPCNCRSLSKTCSGLVLAYFVPQQNLFKSLPAFFLT